MFLKKIYFIFITFSLTLNFYPSFSSEIIEETISDRTSDRTSDSEVDAENFLFNITGYIPANASLLESAPQHFTKKANFLLGSPRVSVDPDVITELPLIKEWTADLIYNQGKIGSCTANSAAFTIAYLSVAHSDHPHVYLKNDKGAAFLNPDMLRMSRNYQYYNTRFLECKINQTRFNPSADSGASIIGAILALDKYGCTPETAKIDEGTIKSLDLQGHYTYTGWPYDTTKFNVQPDPDSYHMALDSNPAGFNAGTPFDSSHSFNGYARISQTVQYEDLSTPFRQTNPNYLNTDEERKDFRDSILTSLARNQPIMMGTMLDKSFMRDQKGYIPTPNLKTFKPVGGHAMSVVGYGPYNHDAPQKRYYKIINSWDKTWGQNGFGFLEDTYFENVNKFAIEAYSISLNQDG